jgi:SAM-dependent methyltransferase
MTLFGATKISMRYNCIAMDDKNFNQETAEGWIQMIEHPQAQIREQDIYPLLRTWITQTNPHKILEIGCGQGICSSVLDLTNRHYLGVDPSTHLLERAQKLHSSDNKKFVLGNAYSLPLQDASVDGVFSVSLWHLLRDIKTASLEMARVLQAGGHFLIITANSVASAHWTSPKDTLYLRSQEEIKSALESAGLQVLKIDTFRSTPDGHKMYVLFEGQKIL